MPKAKKGADNVKVVVRCRPLNTKEKSKGYKSIVNIKRGGVHITNPSGGPPKEFSFDLAFAPDSKQTDIYNETARPIVDSVLEGFNGTIFAYGQTGTGKTFTMEGVRTTPELRGIIPNSFAHIFGHISRAAGETKFLVRCSYLEIYCEDVRDLLAPDCSKKLQVKERPDVGVYVKDLRAVVVKNADELDKIMTKGNQGRMVGATNMNEQSSRSHAIFTILIERSDKGLDGEEAVRMGKLNLVDLAGSERQSKTGAAGQRLHEANKINLSLSTLGNVISSLVDGKSTHVPYRDSKLTRLLQDSLGGNAKTVMIANFGPAEYNFEETISTLRYANRAKQIKNKPKINENPKDALLREYQQQIEELRKQLGDGGDGSSGGESESDSEEEVVGWDGKKVKKSKGRRRKKGKDGKTVSSKKMEELQAQINAERDQLLAQTNMAAEEKERIAKDLAERENTLMAAKQEREALQEKMAAIENRVIVGGVNLLEKAQEQEQLLLESQQELEHRAAEQQELEQAIKDKDLERLDIEEQYGTLQEEAAGKTKKLEKLAKALSQAKDEINELHKERQMQTEDMLATIRELSRELRLSMLIIDNFVPPNYQDEIEKRAVWDEAVEEWHIPGMAYTGNSLNNANAPLGNISQLPPKQEVDPNRMYLSYGSMVDGNRPPKAAKRPKTSKSSGRKQRHPESSTEQYPVSRPSTAKTRFA